MKSEGKGRSTIWMHDEVSSKSYVCKIIFFPCSLFVTPCQIAPTYSLKNAQNNFTVLFYSQASGSATPDNRVPII